MSGPSAPTAAPMGGQTMAGAMQLAIGLLTASLDSPELEAWPVQACRFLLALAPLMSHANGETRQAGTSS